MGLKASFDIKIMGLSEKMKKKFLKEFIKSEMKINFY
jgi:hypothetical protein